MFNTTLGRVQIYCRSGKHTGLLSLDLSGINTLSKCLSMCPVTQTCFFQPVLDCFRFIVSWISAYSCWNERQPANGREDSNFSFGIVLLQTPEHKADIFEDCQTASLWRRLEDETRLCCFVWLVCVTIVRRSVASQKNATKPVHYGEACRTSSPPRNVRVSDDVDRTWLRL